MLRQQYDQRKLVPICLRRVQSIINTREKARNNLAAKGGAQNMSVTFPSSFEWCQFTYLWCCSRAIRCCIWVRALYTYLLVVTFEGSLPFNWLRMCLSLTIETDKSTDVAICFDVNLPRYECPSKYCAGGWLWMPFGQKYSNHHCLLQLSIQMGIHIS